MTPLTAKEPPIVKVLFFPIDAPPEVRSVSATFESVRALVGPRTVTYPASTFFRTLAFVNADLNEERPEPKSRREFKLRPPIIGPFVIAAVAQPRRNGPILLRDIQGCEVDQVLTELTPNLAPEAYRALMIQLEDGVDWLET